MKIYYFDELVTLLIQIKEFQVAKIRFKNGQELYVNSRLLSTKKVERKNIIIRT